MKKIIEKLDYFGNGITYVDDVVTFVPYALPEEEVDIDIIKSKKKFCEAKCNEIIKKSSKRVEPHCPYFTHCGGCHLQHLKYEDTLDFKLKKLKNIFYRNRIICNDIIIHSSSKSFHYRNKISLKAENNKIGYYQAETHKIIEINLCSIANSSINECIKKLKQMPLKNGEIILRTNHNEELLIIVNGNIEITRKDFSSNLKIVGIIVNNKCIYGDDFLITKINKYLFKYSYDSFFQVNNDICSEVLELISKTVTDGNVLDLYCGVGSLSIAASKKSNKVYGIEIVPNAIKNALDNVKINKKENMFFLLGDVEKTISKIKDSFDWIMVDPPRKGLDKNTINFILNRNIPNMIYMSCDPVTLARDLVLLQEKYDIETTHLFDMFPYTYHVECVSVLHQKHVEK